MAELRIGHRRLAVRLCNQSSGGFGIVAGEAPGVMPGDIVELTTAMGQFEARVAYLRPAEIHEEHAAGTIYWIGLERLDEAQPECQRKSAVSIRSYFAGYARGLRVLLAGLLVAVAIIGIVERQGAMIAWLRGASEFLWRPFTSVGSFLK